MKKLFLFGALLAAGLAVTSCSDSNDSTEATRLDGEGEGYISIGISMPTVAGASTRANDTFDNGTQDEWDVTDAYLMLFTGSDESSSTFAGIYSLNAKPLSDNASDQISKEAQVSTKIEGSLLTGTNVYAYVILNQNGVVTNYDSTTPTAFTFANNSITTSTTFATFSAYTMSASTIHNGSSKYFLMTNAVVSALRGGDNNPSGTGAGISTLALLDKSKIYATQSEAEAHPAGHVDVERAAVKVTVTCTQTALKDKSSVTFTNFGWALGNTNRTYYNTRKWTKTGDTWNWLGLASPTSDNSEGTPLTTSLYRFVSAKYLDNGTTQSTTFDQDRARTYWCEDPNYQGKDGLESTTIPAGSYTNTSAASAYTTENTFDVAHQTFENTTYVGIQLKFNDDSFYTASTYGESEILQKSEDDGFTHSSPKKSVKEYILKTYLASRTDIKDYMTANGTAEADYLDAFELKMTDNTTTGTATISKFTTASGKPAWPETGTALPTVEELNSAIKFKYFADGMSYYGVRIKHFGAGGTANSTTGAETGCETPWNSKIHSANTVAGVYQQKVVSGTTTPYDADQQNQYFLGRYGVVRNNWYDVTISAVRKIGSPVPLTPGDTPDDEIDNYLSVNIHILSWAKRIQSTEL